MLPPYLSLDDAAAYGVPKATAAELTQASSLIDAYLKRRDGLLYGVDATGNPAYMARKTATATLQAPNGIPAGVGVSVALSGPVTAVSVGDVLLVDRATAAEALLVTALNGASVTFARVDNAHAAGCALEAGLLVVEERTLPDSRPLTLLSYPPVARLLSGLGRYGYTRRSVMNELLVEEYNLLATMSHFGGPPQWEPFPVDNAGFDRDTGRIWIPSGALLAYFTDIRVQYVAGYSYASLPDPIKSACANVVAAFENFPELNGNIRRFQAGQQVAERFADQVLDADTKTLLDPWCARTFI